MSAIKRLADVTRIRHERPLGSISTPEQPSPRWLSRVLPVAGYVPLHHERGRVAVGIEVEGQAVGPAERGIGVGNEADLIPEQSVEVQRSAFELNPNGSRRRDPKPAVHAHVLCQCLWRYSD